MGLFSSIGSIFGSGGSWLGGIADGILGMNDANKANARKQANYNGQMQLGLRQQQFNEDYARNVMQWRVEDAKKAGVHPMAALGMNSPSLGSVSVPSDIGTYNPIDMGQSTNYAATKAKTSPQQKQMVDLQIRGMELDNEYKQAQIDQLKVDTLASSIASDQALTSPPSPKVNQEVPSGMPEPPKAEDLFTFVLDGKGKKTRLYPTDFMTSAWEDRPAGTSLAPLAEAEKLEQDAKMRGTVVLGHVWSRDDQEFVPVGSAAGKRALDLWKRIGSASRFERYQLKYPKEKMNSIDRAFFDWVDRTFN